jgi:hypothetical protein
MNVFDVLEPIFGDLSVEENRKRMMREWLQSKAFKVSGLDALDIEAKVLAGCRNGSDFIRIVMEEVAQAQGVDRWIDSTPTNVPHMLRISRDFPDAQFIHIIRDARDVALSLDKRQWSRPLPWDRDRSLLAAGIYWEWIVRRARQNTVKLGPKCIEVHYEELVEKPQSALTRIGKFLGHDLDYEKIQQSSVGSVKKPLTSFKEDLKEGHFSPVGRWKEKFPPGQLMEFENLIGSYLEEMGYELSQPRNGAERSFHVRRMRWVYRNYYDFKQWAKVNTPASRWLVSYSDILIDK